MPRKELRENAHPHDVIIGANIRKARMGEVDFMSYVRTPDEGGMPTKVLAERMTRRGFPWSAAIVTNIEVGHRQIRAVELIAVAQVLGVSLETLLKGIRLPKETET